MRTAEKVVQRRVALALSHLCSPDDQKVVFIDYDGKNLVPSFTKLPFCSKNHLNWFQSYMVLQFLQFCCYMFNVFFKDLSCCWNFLNQLT